LARRTLRGRRRVEDGIAPETDHSEGNNFKIGQGQQVDAGDDTEGNAIRVCPQAAGRWLRDGMI
jgi:hypothetical protein